MHGQWWHCELAIVYVNCDVPLALLHILVGCLCYDKDCLTFHLHGTSSTMLGDVHCNVSNILEFSNAIGLARSV
jgi:hypothetical protein